MREKVSAKKILAILCSAFGGKSLFLLLPRPWLFRDRVRIILYCRAIERKNAFSSFFVKEREKKSFLFERKVKKVDGVLLPPPPNFIKVPYLASYCYRVIEGTDGL